MLCFLSVYASLQGRVLRQSSLRLSRKHISSCCTAPFQLSLHDLTPTCRPGIALDHHLRPVIDNVESDLRVPGNSVNAVTKRLEHARIVADNQQILQRICKSKGQYSGPCAPAFSCLALYSTSSLPMQPTISKSYWCLAMLQLSNGNKKGNSKGSMQKFAGVCSLATAGQQPHLA